jgi:hypothetical protein
VVGIIFADNWDTEAPSNFGNKVHPNHESKLSEGDFEIFVRPDRAGKREFHQFHWQPWAIRSPW